VVWELPTAAEEWEAVEMIFGSMEKIEAFVCYSTYNKCGC